MTTDSSTPENDTPDDDWDLDDDDLSLDPGAPGAKVPNPRASEKARSANPSETPKKAEPMPAEPAPQPNAATPPRATDPSASRSSRSSRTTASPGKPSAGRSTSALEKLSLFIVLLLLIGLVVWGITTFYSEAPEGELVEFTTEFPVSGEKVTVASIETWWREPVRSGDEVDVGVVIEAQLIPCAQIDISEGSSTTLQVSFRDADDQLIGDIINLSVENGRFTKSDAPSVTIHATDGFHNASEINPYVNRDTPPWSLVIVESSDGEGPLVKARVSAERKEN